MKGLSPQRGRALVNGLIVLLFAASLGAVIAYFHDAEPNVSRTQLRALADKMHSSATHAHWQWQAEEQPPRIMLIHYNQAGKEVDRRPVAMARYGMPRVPAQRDGCDQLWQMLLNVPMQVDGFRVRGYFIRGPVENGEALDARCRFSTSTGDRFDYFIRRGTVEHG